MHDKAVHDVHGFVSPSPENRTILEAMIPAMLTIRPKDRKNNNLNRLKYCLSSPKKRGETS